MIQGGSLGLVVTILFGMKVDIMLRKVLLKNLTCQFGSGFGVTNPRKCLRMSLNVIYEMPDFTLE